MIETRRFKCCTWCRRSDVELTKDHVFPRSIGGTKELAIPACRTCQAVISRAEQEVARRSEFALYRLVQGPPPRNKSRPDSGSVEAQYTLVKEWLGGYSEVVLRAKSDPVTLPRIECNTSTFDVRVRGTAPRDVDRLVETILKVVEGPPDKSGLIGEVTVELLSEEDTEIASDPDFWPRAFLDLSGRLKIRARNGEEATRLFPVLVALAERGVFKDHSRWTTGEVHAGTPHHVHLAYDSQTMMRVVAKIAYAIARHRLPSALDSEELHAVRRFVLGEIPDDATSPVREISSADSIKEWPDHHVVMIESLREQVQGIVVLYGACFVVDLGGDPLLSFFEQPIVAMSRRDGTRTHFAADDVRQSVVTTLRHYVENM